MSSSLSSSKRLLKVKGSSPVPHGWRGSFPRAVREDRIPKDPKGFLSPGSSSSSLSESSWEVGALFRASLLVEANIVASCSEESIPLPASQGCSSGSLASAREGGLVGGHVGTPLCSNCTKLIPGSG